MTKAPSWVGELGGQARKVPTASSLQPGWAYRDPAALSEALGTPTTVKFIHSSSFWKGAELRLGTWGGGGGLQRQPYPPEFLFQVAPYNRSRLPPCTQSRWTWHGFRVRSSGTFPLRWYLTGFGNPTQSQQLHTLRSVSPSVFLSFHTPSCRCQKSLPCTFLPAPLLSRQGIQAVFF